MDFKICEVTGDHYFDSIPKEWIVAHSYDFFLNDKFIINKPFLAYAITLGRYYGYRTREETNIQEFLKFIDAKYIYVLKT